MLQQFLSKKTIIAGCLASVVLLCMVFWAGVQVGAADSEPGSVSDPLVSKSYLDSRLNGLSGVMTKVSLPKNAVLSTSEGSNMVVYSGNGTVSGGGSGLLNVTNGEMTATGMSLAKYNTYLFPDATTTVTATSDMVLFVSGTYKVQK